VPAPEFTVVSPITLRVNVANGAVAGPISVTTAAGTGTSSQSFTSSLSINGYTPTRGPAGAVVDIYGIGFTQTAIVKFNGTRAHPVTFVSPREVRTSVSAGTTTGPIITVTTAAGTVRGIGKYSVIASRTISEPVPDREPRDHHPVRRLTINSRRAPQHERPAEALSELQRTDLRALPLPRKLAAMVTDGRRGRRPRDLRAGRDACRR
jgi:hypothetical protein